MQIITPNFRNSNRNYGPFSKEHFLGDEEIGLYINFINKKGNIFKLRKSLEMNK